MVARSPKDSFGFSFTFVPNRPNVVHMCSEHHWFLSELLLSESTRCKLSFWPSTSISMVNESGGVLCLATLAEIVRGRPERGAWVPCKCSLCLSVRPIRSDSKNYSDTISTIVSPEFLNLLNSLELLYPVLWRRMRTITEALSQYNMHRMEWRLPLV